MSCYYLRYTLNGLTVCGRYGVSVTPHNCGHCRRYRAPRPTLDLSQHPCCVPGESAHAAPSELRRIGRLAEGDAPDFAGGPL